MWEDAHNNEKTCKDTPDDVKKKSLCNQKCPQLSFLIRKNEGKALLNVKECRKMGWKWPHNRSIPFYIDRVRLSVIFVTVTPMTIYRKLSNLVRIAFLRIASHSEVGYYRYYLTWSKGWTRKVVSSCAAFTASTFAASQFSPATITLGRPCWWQQSPWGRPCSWQQSPCWRLCWGYDLDQSVTWVFRDFFVPICCPISFKRA